MTTPSLKQDIRKEFEEKEFFIKMYYSGGSDESFDWFLSNEQCAEDIMRDIEKFIDSVIDRCVEDCIAAVVNSTKPSNDQMTAVRAMRDLLTTPKL